MSSIQRVIKYAAIGFALALMVTILTAITAVVGQVDRGISWNGNENYIDFTKEYDNIENLDLTNYSGKMYIQVGTSDKTIVKATNVPDTVIADVKDEHTLYVKADDDNFWWFDLHFFDDDESEESQITIYLPENFEGKKVEIDNHSGRLEINGIKAEKLDISGGSGFMLGSNLIATDGKIDVNSGAMKLDNVSLMGGQIKGGSGELQITNGQLNNVKLSLNSGSTNFEGSMTGQNELNGGSGSITMNLNNPFDSYELDIDAGSGSIWVNGDRVDDEKIRNSNAVNELEVDGGSGRIKINFVN